MTTITLSQPIDYTTQFGSPLNPKIFPLNTQVGERNLGWVAQKIRSQVKRVQKRQFSDWRKIARELFNLEHSCHQQFGEKAGKKEFRKITEEWFSDCYKVVNLVMFIFKWFEQLPRIERQLVARKASSWPLDTLKLLPRIPIPLDNFFTLVDLLIQEKGKITSASIEELIKALQGKRLISWDKPLKIADFAFLLSVGLYFSELPIARERAASIAAEAGRKSAYLEDALAALESMDCSVVMGEIEKVAVKEEKLYSEVEVEQRIQAEVEQRIQAEIERRWQQARLEATEQFQVQYQKELASFETAFGEMEERYQQEKRARQAEFERARQLELENIALRKQLPSTSVSETPVEVTPLVESHLTTSDDGDVFDLTLWEPFQIHERVQTIDITPVESPVSDSFSTASHSHFEAIVNPRGLKIRDQVRVIDKDYYRDYYGCTGNLKGRSENAWWVRLDDGEYKQFPASALEQIPQSQASSESMFPLSERVVQKLTEVEPTLFGSNLHPVAG
jgi:hypothetical protein